MIVQYFTLIPALGLDFGISNSSKNSGGAWCLPDICLFLRDYPIKDEGLFIHLFISLDHCFVPSA